MRLRWETLRQSEISSIVLFILSHLLEEVSCVWCYRCGTLNPSNETTPTPLMSTHPDPSSLFQLESCNHFGMSGVSRSPYLVECGRKYYDYNSRNDEQEEEESYICAKIATWVYTTTQSTTGNEEPQRVLSIQRGCIYGKNSVGTPYGMGCGFIAVPTSTDAKIIQEEHICYCNSNYCNKGTQILNHALIIPITISIYSILN